MKVYVVSDVHGKADKIREALYGAGLFDNHGVKDPKAFVVQIGDLANCVKDSIEGDLECLSMVGKEIDLMLIGNHEIPYFDATNYFSGFHFMHEISNKLWSLFDQELIAPCFNVGDTLISHAGVSKRQVPAGIPPKAFHIQKKMEGEWKQRNFNHPLFSDIGHSRGGMAKVGGMLWCDFNREFVPTDFPQIVGHTPGVLRHNKNAICIDTGAKHGGTPTVMRVM